MKFQLDHDYHIHSNLSPCGGDPSQTKDYILDFSRGQGYKQICITDHYWDRAVPGMLDCYTRLDFDHISQIKPLPQAEDCKFLFGCETDMDRNCQLGIPEERFDDFDFIVIPISHLHFKFACDPELKTVPYVAEQLVKRFDALMDKDLPFEKVGLAHFTCSLLFHKPKPLYLDVLSSISDETYAQLFARYAKLGGGLELNMELRELIDPVIAEIVLRPYRIAKEQGCKFYLGSDAHTKQCYRDVPERFRLMVDLLDLEESDKFILKTK